MVVMQIAQDLKVGGAQKFTISLCNALVKDGIEVILVNLGEDNSLAYELRAHPNMTLIHLRETRYSIVLLPLFLFSVLKIVVTLAAAMRRMNVDVVQGHLANASLLGTMSALLARVPRRYATFHSVRFLPRNTRMDLRNWLMLGVLRLFSRVVRFVAVSEAIKESLISRTGVPPSCVVTISNGIDSSSFEKYEGCHELRKELGIQDHQKVITCVGTLHEAKGHPYLLEAGALLTREFPDLVCLLVGDGAKREELENLAAKLHLESTVRFLGTRGDVVRILALSDVFVLPSLWEGLPIALLEAMAMELPCVATRVAGTAEVLEDGVNGILVDSRNSLQLADSIRATLVDEELASRLGRKAKQDVLARYDIASVAAKYLDLYRQ